jgi:hypothetical protein
MSSVFPVFLSVSSVMKNLREEEVFSTGKK